jgi:coenzyme F420-reducing hydrogenase beta subunit
VKEELKKRPVLFCGSPCQVAGLHSYLGKKNDNLYTIDFICRGMNSPKAYKAWLREIEEKEKAKVTRVWFKYKENGWKKSPRCTRIDLSNGKYIVQKGEFNPFMSGYLGPNLYIRPSCSDCQFKGFIRFSAR